MKILHLIIIFISGVVVSNNLGILMETNPDYTASWVNVVVASSLALISAAGVLYGK